jgi:hypothetical protein
MSCVANADLAVTGGILGTAALRVRFLRRWRPGRARRARRDTIKVPAEA